MKTAIYHSPFGDMELSYEEDGVISLQMAKEGTKGEAPFGLALTVFRELSIFRGEGRLLTFPAIPRALPFRKRCGRRSVRFPMGKREATGT